VNAGRAVVFDFDGVLADTEGLHLRAFQEVFARRGWTLDREAYFERYLGFDDHDLVTHFANDRALPLSQRDALGLVEEKTRLYDDRLAAGAVLFEGAAAAIARLGARYRLAIASGSIRSEILAVLDAAGLQHAIPVVVGADDVDRSKPAPDPYLKAVAALGVPPSHAVAIEDSRWGLASARAAGLRTIGITTSYPAQALAPADAVVHSLDAIDAALVDSLLDRL